METLETHANTPFLRLMAGVSWVPGKGVLRGQPGTGRLGPKTVSLRWV